VRVAHLSDLHLGYRAFPRLERGGNLRERDLAAAFNQAIQEVARLTPDVVLLSGDLFHRADPPSTAFLTLTRGIRRFQELLPDVQIFAIAGESDTPSAPGDPGPVAVLDAVPGVEAAAGAPRAVHLARLDAHVLLVPHRAVVRPPFPELRPDPGARWNLLLLRGHVTGAVSEAEGSPSSPPALLLEAAGWDYVALGGSHQVRHWGGNVHGAGSLERVGPDPWREGAAEKGFLLADLEGGTVEFHPLPTRPVVDLAPIRAEADNPEAGTRRLRDLLEGFPGGVDGKLLRVRVRGDLLTPSEGVSAGLLAAVRRKAAHVEVSVEAPGESSGDARPADPDSAGGGGDPVVLNWRVGAGRTGAVSLTPGLWVVTAASPGDLEIVASALERVWHDPSGPPSAEAVRLAFQLEGLQGPLTRRASSGQASGDPESSVARAGARPSPAGTASEARADWIEAAGDAEARALEWVRERQEADSRLVAYRERARELRERIRILREEGDHARCPTCRRPLAEAHPALLALLEEEWEDVLQDGTWWKRRRAQLEDKPPELLALERRALLFQSALDPGPTPPRGQATSPGGSRRNHISIPDASRPVLRRAGFLLQRATEGRLEGLRLAEEGGVEVVESGGHARSAAHGEEALVALVLEAAEAGVGGGSGERVHLLLAGRSGVETAELARLLDAAAGPSGSLASSRSPARAVWLAVVPSIATETLAHRLRGTLEVTRDDEDRLRLRVAPSGRARVRFTGR